MKICGALKALLRFPRGRVESFHPKGGSLAEDTPQRSCTSVRLASRGLTSQGKFGRLTTCCGNQWQESRAGLRSWWLHRPTTFKSAKTGKPFGSAVLISSFRASARQRPMTS